MKSKLLFGTFKTLNELKYALLVDEEKDLFYYDKKKDKLVRKKEVNHG